MGRGESQIDREAEYANKESSRNMQNCFREHPDVYGAELDDDEAPEGEEALGSEAATSSGVDPSPASSPASSSASSPAPKTRGEKIADGPAHAGEAQGKTERAQAARGQVKADHEAVSESEEMVPKAWHDSK